MNEIKKLEDYTTEEKLQKFDEFYRYAWDVLNTRVTGGRNKDVDYYAFELIFNLLGDAGWEIWNSIEE